MAWPSGIDRRKADKSLCLVVGCDAPALYRARQTKRGYCKQHRDRAVASVTHSMEVHLTTFDELKIGRRRVQG